MSKGLNQPQEKGDKPAPRKHSETAPTLYAQVSPDLPSGQPVEQTRGKTGCAVIAVLCMGMAASGAVGTLGYRYVTGQSPFEPKEQTVESPASSASVEKTDTVDANQPEKILSNQDLHDALEANHISATAENFKFDTGRPELQAKAIYMLPPKKPDAIVTGQNLQWLPARDRIVRADQSDLLVAVKVVNPYLLDNPASHFVSEGLPYRAWTADDKDPSIIYFYLSGEDIQGGEDTQLAQIALSNPSRPKQLMWARSFRVAK